MTNRRILRLSGGDTEKFLQDLITNDVTDLKDRLVYAALLTPQGKFIADFFIKRDGQDYLLDTLSDGSDALLKRLTMYKLRADVVIEDSGLNLQRGTGPLPETISPETALPDPRHPALGWRAYTSAPESDDGTDWDAIRVAHCIPETGIELTPDTFILEAGFERLNGVDFKKGCYVGQEVTARMKHKTELRKGLQVVGIKGRAENGTEILAGDKTAGTLHTQIGNRAIAYLRFDRITDQMTAGDAQLFPV